MIHEHKPGDLFNEAHIDEQLKTGKEVIIQFVEESYHNEVLDQVNKLCARHDSNFAVRFYGHYSGSFDCKHLLKIPEVKNLYVDCLTEAKNVTALQELPKLEKLSLGIWELKETEILNAPNLTGLTELVIGATKTKAFNLEYLRDYKNLTHLIVAEHSKNIDTIGELSSLENLSFHSLKKTPVPFVNRLKKLKTLKFALGGRENIHEIEENEIENVEIMRVRGFNDLSNISKFRKLKTLLTEDLIQLPGIDFDSGLHDLENLKIINCKTLNSLTGLDKLTSLNRLMIYNTGLDFKKLIDQPLPEKLKIFSFYTTKQKEDKEIAQDLASRGYSDGLPSA